MQWMVLAGLAACGGIDRKDFPERYARVECARLERCELGELDDTYRTERRCRRDIADLYRKLDRNRRGCEYLPDQAGKCVRRIRRLSCEDFEEQRGTVQTCDLVWDCGPTFTYTSTIGSER